MASKILKIGHRGAKGYEPENTIASFQKALDLGADMIEFDVRVCQSGQLVVNHDQRVDRTTSGHGYIADFSLSELKQLKIEKNQSILTMEEVLDFINRRVKVNIEIKSVGAAQSVVDTIEKYVKEKGWAYDDFLVSSFNHYEIQEVRRLNPKIRIGALISNIPIGLAKFAQDLGDYSLHPNIEFVSQELIDDAHKRGIKVFVWGLYYKEDVEKLKKMGVDGIFTDFPDWIKP